MLETRAGSCPNCNEEVSSDVKVCPNCGQPLAWNRTNDEQRRAALRPDSATGASATKSTPPKAQAGTSFLRLFVLFVIACLATMAAVTFRSKYKTDAPEIEAYHAILVSDAETFRDQIKASAQNSDAPEAALVLGTALPGGKDVLEITVRNEWKTLDYPMRLNYAAKFVERWKSIHAPHRSNISILDESAAEIGGRTWTGTVWVQEKHPDAPRAKPTAVPGTATNAPSTQPTPDTNINATANATTTENATLSSTAGATTGNASTPGEGVAKSSTYEATNQTATNSVSNSAPASTQPTPAPTDPNDLSNIEDQ